MSVAADTSPPVATARPLPARPLPALTRDRLYGGLFLLALLNALGGSAVAAVQDLGLLAAALSLFNVSAVVWTALAAGLAILWREPDGAPARRLDLALAAVVLIAALVPLPTASAVALSLVAVVAVASAPSGSPLRRAGLIFLAVTGTVLWGKLFLTVFTRPVLEIDSWLMSTLLGVHQEGNVVWREGGTVAAVVSTGCSSIHGISVAIVCWTVVSQYFRVPFDRRAVLTVLAAILATMAVNILRIGGILVSPEWAHIIHDGWGAALSMWISLILVVAICLFGARRDVFARA